MIDDWLPLISKRCLFQHKKKEQNCYQEAKILEASSEGQFLLEFPTGARFWHEPNASYILVCQLEGDLKRINPKDFQ